MNHPEEIIFAEGNWVQVDQNQLEDLIARSKKNARRRCRLCAHSSEQDSVHEMFIVHEAGTCVVPHLHSGKSESFHLIQGDITVIVFSDDGKMVNKIEMGDFNSGKPYYYRITPDIYHTLLIHSDFAIFHETTSGPFKREDTKWASWAPKETETDEVTEFMQRISHD